MIGDEGATNIAKVLSQCTTLTCLDFRSNMIGDEGAINIANVLCNTQCPTLNCLNLSSNMIKDKGIMRLKEIQSQYYNLAPKQLLFDGQLSDRSKRFRRKD
jgi:Ran GTPase-activating protein (RanGAP) involved in mRNA processing and transport